MTKFIVQYEIDRQYDMEHNDCDIVEIEADSRQEAWDKFDNDFELKNRLMDLHDAQCVCANAAWEV